MKYTDPPTNGRRGTPRIHCRRRGASVMLWNRYYCPCTKQLYSQHNVARFPQLVFYPACKLNTCSEKRRSSGLRTKRLRPIVGGRGVRNTGNTSGAGGFFRRIIAAKRT